MTKKVYDLAKEYGMQSKDFVLLLQQVNIPVKNHMSALSDQQEKYFRNNFDIVNNQIITKSQTAAPAEPKPAKEQPVKKAAPQARPQGGSGQAQDGAKPPHRPQTRDASARPSSGQQQPYGRSNREGSGQKSGGYQNRDAGQNRDPNRTYSKPRGSYQDRQGQGADGRGPQRDYRGPNPNRPSGQRPQGASGQNRDGAHSGPYTRPQGGYQGRQGGYQGRQGGDGRPPREGGYPNKDRPQQSGQWNKDARSQKPQNKNFAAKKPSSAFIDKPLEKSSKIDKTKKENKQKNEAKSKAREKFYNDDKPVSKMDNTKRTRGTKASYKKKKLADKEERMTSGVTGVVVLPESISVSDLSEKILISSAEIIKILMSYGIMANINQTIDFETASVVCEELNITVELEEEENIYDKMLEQHYADEGKLVTRPPIITVMGHVDHGKTSLLDYLRHTNVISGEAGGITQHVGAYTVKAKDKAITFIDTPGHEAFTAMRSRGASVTDIAVLVIAADDGIKPQTVEAISHAKAAKVPIVVAINKIDKPEANPEKVKQELTEYQLVPEDWGGETICVNISAKTGEGIDKLLEMILLVAEVEDLKANMDQPAIGTVIEARIDKLRGITATLLVKSGVLREGDIIVSGTIYGKVRTLVNDKGTKIVKLGPSMAAEMTGLSEVPSAGDKFYVVENEKDAKTITERKKDRIRLLASRSASKMSLDDLFNQMAQSEAKQVELIVKADVQGSLEAVTQALEKLNDNEDGIKVSVIHSGVGAVSESDVLLASASKTVILAFNVKTDNAARLAAAKEEIDIRTYEVIYDLLDEIKDAMKGMKDPEYREVVTGEAEVRQVFKVPSIGAVAGCYVTNGTVKRSESVRVLRDGKVIHTGRLNSLKRFKDDVKEVATGYECGIGIEKFNDIAEGDKLEFFKNEEIKE